MGEEMILVRPSRKNRHVIAFYILQDIGLTKPFSPSLSFGRKRSFMTPHSSLLNSSLTVNLNPMLNLFVSPFRPNKITSRHLKTPFLLHQRSQIPRFIAQRY